MFQNLFLRKTEKTGGNQPTLTVLENVMLPMDFCNVYIGWKRREIVAWFVIPQSPSASRNPISSGRNSRASISRRS